MAITLSIRKTDGKEEVFDIVRQRYVALTPEEHVRQSLIHLLHEHYGYPLEIMQVEGAITVNGMSRRCDIVLYDKKLRPAMIVETKRPDVPINQKVVDQVCRYNLTLRVPYLLLYNGRQAVCLNVSDQAPHLRQLSDIPDWQALQ